MIQEVWKDVKGFEGLYQVSDQGNVRSIFTEIKDKNGVAKKHKPQILKQSMTTTGYKKVEIRNLESKRKSMKVHRLVATAFIPNPENKPFINHIDSNPINNKLSNLEWCTGSENLYHAYKTRSKKSYTHDTEKIKKLYADYLKSKSIFEVASKNNIHQGTLQRLFKENGFETSRYKYNTEVNKVISLIKSGLTNSEISKLLGCNNGLIARRRYQLKRGMIK